MAKFRLLLPLLVGVAIILGLAGKVGASSILAALAGVDFTFIALFELCLLSAIMVKLSRWHLLANHIAQLKAKPAAFTYLLGQIVNEALPIGSGELTRVYLAKPYGEKHYGEWFAAVAFERACDVLFLVFGALISLFLLFPEYAKATAVIFVFVVIGSIGVLAVFLKPRLVGVFVGWLSFLKRFSRKWFERLERFGKSFAVATAYYKNPSSFFSAFAFTALGWLLEVMGQYVLLNGFGVHLAFWQVFALATVSWIIGTFSFLPGGLGAREASFAYLSTLLGAEFAVVFAMTLSYRAMVYLTFIVTGSLAAGVEKKDFFRTVLRQWK
ncbi:flippase-like domain-containing protein [Candidatus Micrarchaeota archaeon]|nr:flippase-like domain-containing protein [Candidatus Micrarchaeota archaeon]